MMLMQNSFRVLRPGALTQLRNCQAPGRVDVVAYRAYSIRERYRVQLEKRARLENKSVDDLFSSLEQKRADESNKKSRATQNNAKDLEPKTEVLLNNTSAAPTSSLGAGAVRSIMNHNKDYSRRSKSLDSYVDKAKLSLHPREEIELIWKARFLESKTEFSGSLEPEVFARLYAAARRYPAFLIPMAAGDGVAFHYAQWQFSGGETLQCLLTLLAEYKLNGEFARPHTILQIHTDYASSKGIVLTNASLQDNQVTMETAALLVLNLQRFYTADPSTKFGAEKHQLLLQFNSGDPEFSVEALIAAAETLD